MNDTERLTETVEKVQEARQMVIDLYGRSENGLLSMIAEDLIDSITRVFARLNEAKTILQQWKCNSCGHTWYPRVLATTIHKPWRCPRCQKKTIEVVREDKS